jgi:curved DNA-binding protein CbpA
MRTAQAFDPYAVLGVPRNASQSEIRAAYRALAAKYHPDRHQGNPLNDLAAEKLTELNLAYEILSDPGRRATHDQGAPAFSRPAAHPQRPGLKLMRTLWFVLAFFLIIRFFPTIIRALSGLFHLGARGLGSFRGTPFVAGFVLLAVLVLLMALRRKRRRSPPH